MLYAVYHKQFTTVSPWNDLYATSGNFAPHVRTYVHVKSEHKAFYHMSFIQETFSLCYFTPNLLF